MITQRHLYNMLTPDCSPIHFKLLDKVSFCSALGITTSCCSQKTTCWRLVVFILHIFSEWTLSSSEKDKLQRKVGSRSKTMKQCTVIGQNLSHYLQLTIKLKCIREILLLCNQNALYLPLCRVVTINHLAKKSLLAE